MENRPKSLGNSRYRVALDARLNEPHIKPQTEFVDRIQVEKGERSDIPYFDPADGGVKASCLFLLEAPGPKAIWTGFVSRNNPDESAKNWFELNEQAGIPRKLTVTWNIVPWYIGSGGKIRAAKQDDLDAGWPFLVRLLDLLPDLRVVVLVGRKAQRTLGQLRHLRPELDVLTCWHPSPMFINRHPENRDKFLHDLRKVAGRLCLDEAGQSS